MEAIPLLVGLTVPPSRRQVHRQDEYHIDRNAMKKKRHRTIDSRKAKLAAGGSQGFLAQRLLTSSGSSCRTWIVVVF
jgi:hypothetical protein